MSIACGFIVPLACGFIVPMACKHAAPMTYVSRTFLAYQITALS